MPTTTDILPLTRTATPSTQEELAAVVHEAHAVSTPIYPIGGGTSLDFGVTPKRSGIGLSLARLAQVVDYPAQDMTITVEAGITMAQLANTLAAQGQRLAIDAADADAATLGGLVATNFSGPHRFGHGTVRDYVIGITAVNGRGTLFHGGGRVVKNVAGYDFCKLLTGSLGTLAVITQLTLKLKPLAERSLLVACPVRDLNQADATIAALLTSRTTPVAIELLLGPAWQDDTALGPLPLSCIGRLVVGLEGTAIEVDWQVDQLRSEWAAAGIRDLRVIAEAAEPLWQRLAQFSAARAEAPLALKAGVLPSRMMTFVEVARGIDADCSIQAHAGNGIVNVRFAKFAGGDVGRLLVGKLQPAAIAAGGHALVLSWNGDGDLVRQDVWGSVDAAARSMAAVKRQFDPRDILNPGRFVY